MHNKPTYWRDTPAIVAGLLMGMAYLSLLLLGIVAGVVIDAFQTLLPARPVIQRGRIQDAPLPRARIEPALRPQDA